MKSIEPVPKRLIVCCDGTWQSSASGKRNIPSNVARLARTIAKAGQDHRGRKWQQIVYYDSGVGTGNLSWFEQTREGSTGDGLVIKVIEAYNFLVNNYAPGDQIFCFGFSRGAFTARSVAGLVTDIGIFKPHNMQSFAPLWAAYQKNTTKREFRKTKEWFEFIHGVRPMVPEGQENLPYTRKPWELGHKDELSASPFPTWPNSNVVEVVGVFDTVGSLGIADTRFINDVASRKRFEYLNVKLSPFINHAFHALALDEHREPFLPTLWYIPNEAAIQAEEATLGRYDDWPELNAYRKTIDDEIRKHQAQHKPDLYQVWFPGVHINNGGGSDETSADAEGLSNVAFAWMVQQLGPHLAFEPWTWGNLGIGGYQTSVVLEERMYNSMKNMPRQEQKEYRGLITKTATENFKDSLSDWGAWLWDGMRRSLGLYRPVKLVPVQPDKITNPQPTLVDDQGKLILPRWGVSEYQDSYTTMYRVMGAPVIRTPGESSDRSREGGLPLLELGKTNEYIHPSVWWRYQTMKNEKGDMKYVSKALLGFKRQQDLKYGSYGYWKSATQVWVPEWFMKPSNEYLMRKGLELYTDKEVDGGLWQYAEWTYTELVDSSEELEEQLARFYVAAQDAKEEMETDGRVFPFGVTREMVKEEAVRDEAAKEEMVKDDAFKDGTTKDDAIKGET